MSRTLTPSVKTVISITEELEPQTKLRSEKLSIFWHQRTSAGALSDKTTGLLELPFLTKKKMLCSSFFQYQNNSINYKEHKLFLKQPFLIPQHPG